MPSEIPRPASPQARLIARVPGSLSTGADATQNISQRLTFDMPMLLKASSDGLHYRGIGDQHFVDDLDHPRHALFRVAKRAH